MVRGFKKMWRVKNKVLWTTLLVFFIFIFSLNLSAYAQTNIYRSVGIFPSDLRKGSATTTLDISGSTATFSSGMPANFGVGDAIQFDSDDNGSIDALAFVHGRTSATSYTVKNFWGSAPTTTSATDQDWATYRAYTSLSNAEGGTENTNINSTVRNFDEWSGGKNITDSSSNEVWNIAAYADGADTTNVIITGWVMSTSTYLRIYTPTSTAEVGATQRHNGAWGNGYRMSDASITSANNFVRLDGLSIKQTASGSERVYFFNNILEAGEIYVSNNFGWKTDISSQTDTFDIFTVASTYYYVWNNIGINDSVTRTAEAFYLNDADVIAYFYNNTGIASAGSAFKVGAGRGSLVNNLGYAATSTIAFAVESGDWWYDTKNNSSNDATADDWAGLNNNINQTFTFLDSANQDYRLASGDAGAKDLGLNISASSTLAIGFNTDINGQSRPYNSTWDIGADELGRGLDQIHYRWRNDDGSETAATWGRNEDTATSSPNVGTVVRLRTEVANPGNASSSQMFLLQYGTGSNPQSGTWTTIPDSSNCSTSPFCMNASSLTEDSATTNVSSGLTDAETTFVAGFQKETTATTTHISLPLNNFTEIEHAFKITRYALNNTAYYFRMATTTGIGDANQLLTYTVTPQMTTAVGATNINQIHYRWRNDDGTETTANWGVAEDTATTTVGLSKTMRLRLEPSNQGTASSSQMYILQYGTGSDPTTGTWTTVPDSSNCGSAPFCMTSSSLTEDSATTNVSSGLTDAQTNFISGFQKETTATTTHISLTTESFTELEYAFQVTSSASNGTTYYFRLATTTGNGTANTLTNYSQTPSMRTIVGVPTNLAATTAGSGQINLSWDQMTSATGYDIYRSTDNSTFTIISTSPVVSSGSTTSYSDTGLSSGTIYYYKILSIESGGSSALSSSVNATTLTVTSSTTNPGGLGLPINAFQAPKKPAPTTDNPQGSFQIIINNNEEKTDKREVLLSFIPGPDTKKMALSNYPDLHEAGIEPFQDLKLWDLCSKAQNTLRQKTCPDSVYTVYAKFYTLFGQGSPIVKDTIMFETKELKNKETEKHTLLIKYPNSPKVYLIKDNKKYWIVNEKTFNGLKYDWKQIQTIPTTQVYPDGPDIKSQELKNRETERQKNQETEKQWSNETMKPFTRFLTLGSKGEEVRQLQTLLKQLNYFTHPTITGYFGAVTRQAVKNFQKEHNIVSVGYVGPATRKALNEYLD